MIEDFTLTHEKNMAQQAQANEQKAMRVTLDKLTDAIRKQEKG